MSRKRKAVTELEQSLEYQNIKCDLLNQLEANGTKGRFYTDLVNDYMDFWVTKSLLIADVKSRGVMVKYNNGGGQSGYKKNDSVQELNKTNAQMLKLLNELGIKPTDTVGDDDDL